MANLVFANYDRDCGKNLTNMKIAKWCWYEIQGVSFGSVVSLILIMFLLISIHIPK